MEYTLTGVAWRGGAQDKNGDIIPTDVLTKAIGGMDEQVVFHFNYAHPVGKVIEAKMDGDDLVVSVDIDPKQPEVLKMMQEGRALLRPGYTVTAMHKDGDVTIIDSVESLHVALCPTELAERIPGESDDR